MICTVVGTPGSGKSALAEELAIGTGDSLRIYLATMKICDRDGEERVKRHRKSREGKGFVTIEKLYLVSGLLESLEDPANTTILLECVSNLVGNEMYDNPGRACGISFDNADEISGEIAADIERLAKGTSDCILVTNRYPADGDDYDDSTRLYVHILNLVNERIMLFSDKVYDLTEGV